MANEITEMWRDNRKAKQAKRASNRTQAKQMLMGASIRFENKNMGAHFIVHCENGQIIDFWPGTGLFIPRLTKKKDRGIRRLINLVQENEHDPHTTRPGSDHPTQPNNGKVGSDLPWD